MKAVQMHVVPGARRIVDCSALSRHAAQTWRGGIVLTAASTQVAFGIRSSPSCANADRTFSIVPSHSVLAMIHPYGQRMKQICRCPTRRTVSGMAVRTHRRDATRPPRESCTLRSTVLEQWIEVITQQAYTGSRSNGELGCAFLPGCQVDALFYPFRLVGQVRVFDGIAKPAGIIATTQVEQPRPSSMPSGGRRY